jgi:hypothetical protein
LGRFLAQKKSDEMENILIVVALLVLFALVFDLGRKWERMEWDGSFDEQETAQPVNAPDGVPPQESGDLTPADVHAKMWRLRQSRRR